jgi:peptidoglycan/xylan/chitin deacetylase (PgdA/CDA1 family)
MKMNAEMRNLLSDRVPFEAIVDRPAFKLPDGKKMLVWIIVNVEHWTMRNPMPRMVLSPPMGQALQPDLPNWAWHEYGMRSGFWRIHEALTSRGIIPTMATNGIVCESYPRVAEAGLKHGWEMMGHGYIQGPMHKLENQQEEINRACEAIKKFSGKSPVGWESPGLTENDHTIDCLSAAGIEYVADWVLDDQPVWIKADPKPVLSVPYTVELNDIPMMLLQSHSGSEMLDRGVLQLNRLREESNKITRVMAISVHPYITGAAHRISYFEALLDMVLEKEGVMICTGEEINNLYRAQFPAPQKK